MAARPGTVAHWGPAPDGRCRGSVISNSEQTMSTWVLGSRCALIHPRPWRQLRPRRCHPRPRKSRPYRPRHRPQANLLKNRRKRPRHRRQRVRRHRAPLATTAGADCARRVMLESTALCITLTSAQRALVASFQRRDRLVAVIVRWGSTTRRRAAPVMIARRARSRMPSLRTYATTARRASIRTRRRTTCATTVLPACGRQAVRHKRSA
jgi:hypothetical protein